MPPEEVSCAKAEIVNRVEATNKNLFMLKNLNGFVNASQRLS
jgi:hypothetical protein